MVPHAKIHDLIEQTGVVEAPGLCYRDVPFVITTDVGQMRLIASNFTE